MMAKENTGGGKLTGLSKEQIAKMAQQESDLAFFATQANETKDANGIPYSKKEMRKGELYETKARGEANIERIAAASAQVGDPDIISATTDAAIAEAEAAMVGVDVAMEEAKKAGVAAQTSPGYTGSIDGLSDEEKANRVSAYNILLQEFTKYGLGSLVSDVKDLLVNRTPASEIPIALQNTKAYQNRFAANAERIKAGLGALSPAEYIGLEDQYQNIMRNYGLPASYYSKDETGKQVGFEKFLTNDVSAVELEDRIATAQQRVLNTNPEVLKALKQFYPDLNNADILAYTLDPKNAMADIKRKVTAAEIGGAALQQGLQALGGTAESLAGQGITKREAQQGYAAVAEMAPRGGQLADIYKEDPYTQQTAEAEVFNTTGAAAAARKRKKLVSLETAAFGGSSGVGALGRDRANGQSGAGAY